VSRKNRHWTTGEDKRLYMLVGGYSLDKIAEMLGRSERSIRHRAEALNLKLREGSVTLHGLCKSSGYDWRQIRRAKSALKQVWARSSHRDTARADGKGGTWFVITDEQAEALIDYLANEKAPPQRWAKGLDRCIKCRRSNRPHCGLGLCSACYQRRKYGERCKDCAAMSWTLLRLVNVSTLRRKKERRRALRCAA